MFKTDDLLMKSFTGLCRVSDVGTIGTRSNFADRLYYTLIPVNDPKTKIFFPADQDSTALRRTMTPAEVEELLRELPEIQPVRVENDRLREQQYKQIVGSNAPGKIAAIIKTLYLRREDRSKAGKALNAIDKHYFDLAEHLLYSEMALALQLAEEEIPGYIEAALSGGQPSANL